MLSWKDELFAHRTPAIGFMKQGGKMKHGQYTARLGKILTRSLREKVDVDAEVFYDHGDKSEPNVCQPTPYFEKYCAATTLANIDLVIISQNNKEIMLCEIEEEGANPKKIIGDVVALFLAEGIRIKNEDYRLDDFDQIHLILGIVIKRRGKAEDKAK
jgi:hypothetical protein